MNTKTRSYEVKTFGCQMNVHDSERLSGLLEDAGYVQAVEGELVEHSIVLVNGEEGQTVVVFRLELRD